MVAVDQGRDAPGAQARERPIGLGDQRSGEAPSPKTGSNRQAIDITPPAVPRANDRAREAPLRLGNQDHGVRSLEEPPHRIAVVGGARGRLRLPPESEDLVDLVETGGADGNALGYA
jgi:hypothetical protein